MTQPLHWAVALQIFGQFAVGLPESGVNTGDSSSAALVDKSPEISADEPLASDALDARADITRGAIRDAKASNHCIERR